MKVLLAGVAERDLRRFTAEFAGIERSSRAPIDKAKAALAAFASYGQAHPARDRLLFGDPAIASRGGSLEAAAMAGFVEAAQATCPPRRPRPWPG